MTTATQQRWIADPITDADGFVTIRRDDGSDNGNITAEPIATVYSGADALLIAAAPELLEALQKCEAIIGQLCEMPDKARDIALQGYVGHARCVSRAAIAKATA